jgi:hypothetical protein
MLIELIDGVTLVVPPPFGVTGAVISIVIAVLCLLVPVLAIGTFIYTVVGRSRPVAGPESFIAVMYGLMYYLPFGLVLLIMALRILRRRVDFSLQGGRLSVRQSRLFGESKVFWRRDEIVRVAVQHTQWDATLCVDAYGRPQFRLSNRFGVFPYATRDDWEWVAEVLWQALRTPERLPDGADRRPRGPSEGIVDSTGEGPRA